MKENVEFFDNNLGLQNGCNLVRGYYKECQQRLGKFTNRMYHIGLKSLYENEVADTKYIDGELKLAEGMSARLLMFR